MADSVLAYAIKQTATSDISIPVWTEQHLVNRYLCRRCRIALHHDLNDQTHWGPKDTTTGEFWSSPDEVIATSGVILSEDCSICCMVKGSITIDTDQRAATSEFDKLRQTIDGLKCTSKTEISYKLSKYGDLSTTPFCPAKTIGLSFIVKQGNLNACSELLLSPAHLSRSLGPPIDSDSKSYNGHVKQLEIVSMWHKTCLESHSICNQSHQILLPLPTRLIHLKYNGSGIQAHLHKTSHNDSGSKYVTLSHCWGNGVHQKKLLRDNLRSMIEGIEVNALSRIFQDAMVATLRLGFFFIWIDALCIIQDDEHDWARESALMEQVYSGSSINLAATAAPNGDYGCFVQKGIESVYCKAGLKISGTIHKFVVSPVDLWNNEITEAPLNKRGWVLQELILAPRILHFGASQLYWECAETSSSQLFPLGILTLQPPGFQKSMAALLLNVHKNDADNQQRSKDANKIWWRVLEVYSACLLTYVTDKLVAVSAVAAKLQRYMGCRYLAGLWETHLMRDLLWFAIPDSNLYHVRADIAPTWSWASQDSQVMRYPDFLLSQTPIHLVEVLAVQVDLVSNNLFGQVKGGVLKISGPLAAGFLQLELSSEHPETLAFLFSDQPEALDGLLVRVDLRKGESHLSQIHETRDPDKVVYFLPFNYYLEEESLQVEGLVLKRATNSEGHFKRVGYFFCDKTEALQTLKAACMSFDRTIHSNKLDFCRDKGTFGRTWKLSII